MKSCKAFLIGDLHYQKNTVPEDKSNIPNIVKAAATSEPDFIVILGDSLDDHEKVDVQASNVLCELIKQLKRIAKVYILVGNHDYINNKQFLTENHHLNVYKGWKRIVIVDKPIMKKIKGKTFVFCPYTEPGRFREALETLDEVWEVADAVFCHQEIKGASLNERQKISSKGDVWSGKYPPLFSGHIHKSQIIKNIHYPGSSKQVNFGELEDKYLWNVLFGDGEPTITKIKINDTSKSVLRCDVGEIEKISDKTEGEDTKLVVSGTPEELMVFKTTKMKNLEDAGYKIQLSKTISCGVAEVFAPGGVSFMDGFEAVMKKEGGKVYDAYVNVFG